MGLLTAEVPFPVLVIAACLAAGIVAGLLLTTGPVPPQPSRGGEAPGRTTPPADRERTERGGWDTGERPLRALEGQHIVDPAHPHLRRPGPAHRR